MGRHLCPSLALVLRHDVRGVDGKTSVGVDCDTEKPGVCLKSAYMGTLACYLQLQRLICY